MNDKLTETLNRRKIEELSVSQFKQFIHIFEIVKNWVNTELNQILTLKLDFEVSLPSLKSLVPSPNKTGTTEIINLSCW